MNSSIRVTDRRSSATQETAVQPAQPATTPRKRQGGKPQADGQSVGRNGLPPDLQAVRDRLVAGEADLRRREAAVAALEKELAAAREAAVEGGLIPAVDIFAEACALDARAQQLNALAADIAVAQAALDTAKEELAAAQAAVVAPALAATVEPVQDAPEVDTLPDLPAAPVAPAVAQAAPAQESAANGETSNWWAKIPIELKMIGGAWLAMLLLFSIAFPGAGMLAWMAAITGIAVMGWKTSHLASDGPLWTAILVWFFGTLCFASPAVGFIAEQLLPLYKAEVMGPMTWLATTTLVWIVFEGKKAAIGK